MKKTLILLAALTMNLVVLAQSKVYYTKDISADGLVKIYQALGVKAEGRVAVKISTGEGKGVNALKPELIGKLVKMVDGTIVECNTLYSGNRDNTKEHEQTIKEHGYTKIAKVDIMDGKSDMKIPVQDTKHIKYDIVGTNLQNYDFLINLAHFKGHQMAGFGGVIKNQSIGVASAAGKANIHTAGRTTDLKNSWNMMDDQDGFLESMAAAAQGVHNYFKGKVIYIAVMNNMSIDCDCNANPATPLIKDYGILASTDPVALDQACLDVIDNMKVTKDNNTKPLLERIAQQHGRHTVDYAEQIGFGSKKYVTINVDK